MISVDLFTHTQQQTPAQKSREAEQSREQSRAEQTEQSSQKHFRAFSKLEF
jgi:hypothetical protein